MLSFMCIKKTINFQILYSPCLAAPDMYYHISFLDPCIVSILFWKTPRLVRGMGAYHLHILPPQRPPRFPRDTLGW